MADRTGRSVQSFSVDLNIHHAELVECLYDSRQRGNTFTSHEPLPQYCEVSGLFCWFVWVLLCILDACWDGRVFPHLLPSSLNGSDCILACLNRFLLLYILADKVLIDCVHADLNGCL